MLEILMNHCLYKFYRLVDARAMASSGVRMGEYPLLIFEGFKEDS